MKILNFISSIHNIKFLLIFMLVILLLTGCSDESAQPETENGTPPRDNVAQVIHPRAAGNQVLKNNVVSIDISNVSQGYLLLTYTGKNEKIKFQIKTPDNTTYTYLVNKYNSAIVYPLTGGSGLYTLILLESVDVQKNLYAVSFTEAINASIADEFLPFLTPNVYVNFTEKSATVSKGEKLADKCYSDLDVIKNVYHYVIKNIRYDEKKATSVTYGYIPDPDMTLESKTGICFDYASLMTAMLRSQRIPTKLEVGYAGEVYHAWISCYIKEIGWVDNIIEFDGKNWSLIDPTLAANNDSSAVKEYIGEGSNYTVKYTY